MFGERYPIDKPVVLFRTPIFDPNVFEDMRLCFGEWQVGEVSRPLCNSPYESHCA